MPIGGVEDCLGYAPSKGPGGGDLENMVDRPVGSHEKPIDRKSQSSQSNEPESR